MLYFEVLKIICRYSKKILKQVEIEKKQKIKQLAFRFFNIPFKDFVTEIEKCVTKWTIGIYVEII